MAPQKSISELKLDDIDFEVIKACKDKNYLKRYLKLLEDDGNYFMDLIKACKDKLFEVSPKDYYYLYPRATTAQEQEDAMRDILEWEDSVKETDDALKEASAKVKKDLIWDELPGRKVQAPIRGQEPTIGRRPNVHRQEQMKAMEDQNRGEKDVYARDKTKMKDYYSAWDKVDVDALEEDLDEDERREEEERRRHFDGLREQQDAAQATTPIRITEIPGIPEAHRKHMADSEKEKGNEAFYSKDFEEAEAYYTRSLQYKADDPSTWSNRALVRLKLEKAEQALEDCEHALALNGSYMKALHRKGKALYELRRYEDAVKAFQMALAESPGNTQINGDLMVARRKLRSEPEPAARPRRVDAEPSCRIEELDDEPITSAPAAAAPLPEGYTRVQIEEESDSEEEDEKQVAASSPSKSGSGRGFLKVAIEEVSGSEDEAEPSSQHAPAAPSRSPPAASSVSSSGFRKVAIVEEPESEGSTPPAKAAGKFDPPPRGPASPAAAAASEREGGGAGLSFDDMD